MIIKKMFLYNFRNYISEKIELEKDINFIIGENAQGKTNIIEAISYGSYGKSFRNVKNIEMINYNKKEMFIGVFLENKYGEKKIEAKIRDDNKREIKINGNAIIKTSELIGNLNTIIFSSEDLKIINEGPIHRRKFINREISQIDKGYYNNLIKYNKILKQRNNYIRNNKNLDKILIDTFDEKLSEYGAKIILKRSEFVEKTNKKLYEIHSLLSDGKEKTKIKYVSNISNDYMKEYGKIVIELKQIFSRNFRKDIKFGYTTCGPHTDDIYFYINDKNVKKYGSQGQIRTIVLSLILSVLEINKEEVNEKPILLLDDVFSELDEKRKNLILKYIDGVQTIITSTDLNGINKEIIKNSSVFIIENGIIRRN